jgi:hypothetical protein
VKIRPFAAAGCVALAAGSLGCADSADPRRPSNVIAEVGSAIATVIDVRWETE